MLDKSPSEFLDEAGVRSSSSGSRALDAAALACSKQTKQHQTGRTRHHATNTDSKNR